MIKVTILGSSAAMPQTDKYHSAHALNVCEQFYLIDCGEGTQRRLLECGISPLKINAIFISHLHGDHFFGLLPLLSTLGFMGKKNPLKIFAPRPMDQILESYKLSLGGELGFEIQWCEVHARLHQKIYETRSFEVYSIPLRHRVPSAGFLFRTTDGFSYAYCSDTTASAKAAEIFRGVDLLYHETTYLHKDRDLAKKTGHTTALQAARLARKAAVGRMIIGHISPRYKDDNLLLEEARLEFPATELAVEGECYSVK